MSQSELTKRRLLTGACTICVAALAITMGGDAYAQDSEPTDEVSEVIVTGSRALRDGSNQPTPVTVVAIEQLDQISPRNITEALSQLPAFRGGNTPSTPGTGVGANSVGSFLSLRNLGPARTLVLLDGRRVAPGSTNGSTNVDLLPQPLIKRVDIVTGGASSSYGSDAVAGVVNFILDTEYTGMKGRIQGGLSDRGDGGSYKFEYSAGGEYLDGRLHLLASYGNDRINSIEATQQRPWNRPMGGFVTGVAIASGATARLLLRDVRQVSYSGGVILATAPLSGVSYATGLTNAQGQPVRANQTSFANPASLQNRKFLPGGIGSPYDVGTRNNGTNQVGGDGFVNAAALTGLLESETTFFRASYDVSDNLNVYFQWSTADVHNRWAGSTSSTVQQSTYTVFEGNPFIPTPVAAELAAANFTLDTFVSDPAAAGGRRKTALGTRSLCNLSANLPEVGDNPNAPFVRCFKLNRYNADFGRIVGDVDSQSNDIVAGFNATLFDDWRVNGYFEHGENVTAFINTNNIEFENAFAATDVIPNPAVGGVAGVAPGAPVCRIDVTNPGAYSGCLPLNLFGSGSASQAAYDFAATDGTFSSESIQDVVAFNIAGEPFALPAGPLSFAVGGEYRKLSVEQRSDPSSQLPAKFVGARANVRGVPAQFIGTPGGRLLANINPFQGEYDVKEAYAEIDMPLLRDLPFVEELSLNAAGRYTNYSTSGEVKTWKVGVSYRPSELVRLRGTLSRDIRAPNSVELFQTGGRFQRTFTDPFNNRTPVTAFDTSIGDPSLSPEIADGITAGVVITPSWLPGLTATLDYYDIKIEGALENLTSQETLDECFRGAISICDNIEHTGTGLYNGSSQITTVFLPYINLSSFRSKGADLEIGYRTTIGDLPGLFNFRLLVGYLDEQSSQAPGAPVLVRTGTVIQFDNPRVRGVLQAAHENGPVSLSLQLRYIGHGYYDNTLVEGLTILGNSIAARTLADVTARYRFGDEEQYEAFLTINNMFDKEPPFAPTGSATNFVQSNSALYDRIGRYYTTGLRFRF